MRPAGHLTLEQRWAVVSLVNYGQLSFRAAAHKVGCDERTARRIWRLHRDTGGVEYAARHRARPVLTGPVEAMVRQDMVGHEGVSTRKMAKRIRRELHVRVHDTTIARFLHANGFRPLRRPLETRLTAAQRAKRLEWCRRFAGYSKHWWEKVMFVDEKNFGAYWPGNRHNDVVWGDNTTRIPPRHVSRYQASVKMGAVLSYKGKGAPWRSHGRFTGARFCEMLRDYVFPYRRRHFHGETIVFIMDNDPSHLGQQAKTLLRAERLLFEGDYKFPPNSGDLNPVENFWGIVLDKLDEGDELTTEASIEAAVGKAWRQVGPDAIRKMVHSMPERLAECIRLEGARTRW